MKVILQETLEGVGDLGDLLDVSDGFARNYLLPRKKAVEANGRNIKEFEHAKRAAAEKAKKEKQEIEDARQKDLSGFTHHLRPGRKRRQDVRVRDGEGYRGRTGEQGFTVDRRKIQLAQPIKELGTFAIAIKLPREVTATIAVHVVKKQEEPEAVATA